MQTNLLRGDEILNNIEQESVLGVRLDNKLNFATHLLNITKNANKKLNALTKVQKYMMTDQKSFYFPPLLSVDMDALYKRFPTQNK